MSVSYIPLPVRYRLWGKSGGRCEYEGCNDPLWLDSLTMTEFNIAYIAHIIADKPGGPRGDAERSEELNADISNLMLMCDKHHRLIDKEDVAGHPVESLLRMKEEHEERIDILTSIHKEKRSHIIRYGANIGDQSAIVSWSAATQAIVPDYYPAERPAIELSLVNSSFLDSEGFYWELEREHLKRQFDRFVKQRYAPQGAIQHFSIFALAPQPLLIELGHLLSDIPAAEVYQLHREPQDWSWQAHPEGFDYKLIKPDTRHQNVAINLSLSAIINNSRISSVLTEDHTVWTLTIDNPNNDFLKSREQLEDFRKVFRKLLNDIKAEHGEEAMIHIFPAVPNSVAVEMGRTWMPKADLPMSIYEQNTKNGGFSLAFEISNK